MNTIGFIFGVIFLGAGLWSTFSDDNYLSEFVVTSFCLIGGFLVGFCGTGLFLK